MKTKYCPVCQNELALDAFWKNRRGKQGRQEKCKECKRSDDRARYDARKEVDFSHIGGKKCAKCEQEKPLEEFYIAPTGTYGRSPYCKACKLIDSREYYDKRKDDLEFRVRMAERSVKRRYNISLDEYKTLTSGECEICGRTEKLVLDHDHSCCSGPYSCGRCVRGTLCNNCNAAEGFLGSLEAARAMVSYMERWIK